MSPGQSLELLERIAQEVGAGEQAAEARALRQQVGEDHGELSVRVGQRGRHDGP